MTDLNQAVKTHPRPESKEKSTKANRVPFSSYLTEDLAASIRQLSLEVSAYRRVRTSVADLLEEAVRDLLKKYES
ncbi:MAG: ribbon-helix-helix domain-containing protein [Acidobacteria bacterium]|nr:ribbon-helix-helix domain-containing protein [Candidatus Sulfomarinibacter kjeldsenii]